MSSPLPPEPPSTLLLREVPAHAGTAGAGLLGPVFDEVLREVSAARCRMYVLVDLAGPLSAPPVAAALVAMGPGGGEPDAGGGAGPERTGAERTRAERTRTERTRTERTARLRALAVSTPYRGRGLARRLLGDLLTELRADGVRRVRCLAPSGNGDPSPSENGGLPALLAAAGFTREPVGAAAESPASTWENRAGGRAARTVGTQVTYQYDEPESGPPGIVWLVREL
ncbi:GNAT family N-acetyltransferase [Planobispora takensis]|uniref:N-acetyltransferase domain-containing protein n=1 Tax=Planobispora takensis TaxID=1367882 RepID=A0A8J3T5B5_9ACTN|nr:GNAT family N-acetyltransferase [Planobispora takensis]GII05637.1 hypothetical protein Pta02_76450 [Planobispora takensis]